MVLIHASIQFFRYRRYVKTKIMIIFVVCLVRDRFTFSNSGWMIKVVNITICMLSKQHPKGIILVIIALRREFIPKRSTKINLLQDICNLRHWGTSAHYRITIILINSINSILDCFGHIIQGLIGFSIITKTFDI